LSYGVDVADAPFIEEKLVKLIIELSKHNKVVVLIDEYDKPILDRISDMAQALACRDVLRSFYGVLKGMDEYLRFVLLTGITKFAQTSIFSGLNNLNDVSLDVRTATLLGYTDEEIDDNLGGYIAEFAQQSGRLAADIREEMRVWYNGYRFSDGPVKVYNPYSIVHCLDDKKFANYWIGSATPKYLIDLIKIKPQELSATEEVQLLAGALGAFDIEDVSLVSVLFQSGYYTIKNYIPEYNEYVLGYPNKEVKDSFTNYLLITFAQTDQVVVNKVIPECRNALLTNNLQLFSDCLRVLFANIPYELHISEESYYHSLLQLLVTMLHLEASSEISTNIGKIDLVISTPKYIYVFEIKFNQPLGTGMSQIESRRYYEKYQGSAKQIILVEMVFNKTPKNFTIEYQVKET